MIDKTKKDALAPPSGEGVDANLRVFRDMADAVHSRFFWMQSPDKKGNHTVSHESVQAVIALCEEIEVGTPAYENMTTPQPAPVDGETRPIYWMGEEVKTTARLIEIVKEQCSAAIDYVLADDTTPPPASQESGGDESLRELIRMAHDEIDLHWQAHCDVEGYGPANLMRRLKLAAATDETGRCTFCGCGNDLAGVAHLESCKRPCAASPPSSAGEVLMTAREIREANAAGAGIELITEAEEQRRAAEQAKPDGLDAAFEAINTSPAFTVEGLNKALDKAEQAQAGELQEEIQWALNGLPQLAINLRFEGQTSRADTVERIIVILRRLAGGVTVDDAMTERACICHYPRWEVFSDPTRIAARASMRRLLVAALGAGRG